MQEHVTKLIRNFVSSFGLQLLLLLLNFFLIPILIAEVGDEGYGLLVLAATIVGYFSILGVGIPGGTVKFVAEFDAAGDEHQVEAILNSSFAFYLGIGVLVALSLTGLVLFDGLSLFNISEGNVGAAEDLVLATAAVSLFAWPTSVFGQALEGLREYHRKNVTVGLTEVFGVCAAIFAAISGANIVVIFLAQRAIYVVRWTILFALVRAEIPYWTPNPFGFDRRTFKMLFSFSVWLLLGSISVLIVYQTDQLIIGIVLPVAMITVYKVVTQPHKALKALHLVFIRVAMPTFSAVNEALPPERRNEFAYSAARYSNALLGCLAIGGFIYVQPFLRVWVGDRFTAYAWVAQAVLLGSISMHTNGLLGSVFRGAGHVRELAILGFVAAIVNLGLSLWWVHTSLGVTGVILATVCASSVASVAQFFVLFPLLDLKPGRYLRECVIAPIAPSAAIGLLHIPLWDSIQALDDWWMLGAGVAITGGTTVLFIYATVVRKGDKEWLLAQLRGRLQP